MVRYRIPGFGHCFLNLVDCLITETVLFPCGRLFIFDMLTLTIIHFQETLHKHDAPEAREVEVTKEETPVSLSIPRDVPRSGSRKYSVCEEIETPTLLSPFGSFREYNEDDLQHSERSRSQTFHRVPSLLSRSDNGEDYTHPSRDDHQDVPSMNTAVNIQGDAYSP